MNPARQLHALLQSWAVVKRGTSIEQVRAGSESISQSHARACLLLGEIEQTFVALRQQGEDVAPFETFFPSWWDAVILPYHQWNAGVNGDTRVIAVEALATLASYASYLDKTSLRPMQSTPDALRTSRDAVNDILRLVGEQSNVGDDQREYIFMLATEIRTLLDANTARVPVDLIRRLNELRGWAESYIDFLRAADADPTLIQKLSEAAKKVVPATKLAFATGGFMLGMAADTLAITQGLGG